MEGLFPRPLWQRYMAVAVYLLAAVALTQILGAARIYLQPVTAAKAQLTSLPFRFLTYSVVVQMVAFLLPAPLLLVFTRAQHFNFRAPRVSDILLCCGLILANLIAFSALYHYLHIEPKQLAFLDMSDILLHKGAFIVLTAVAVPGYEEWVFRGLMFGILVTGETRLKHVFLAGGFCALLFTASHIEGWHSLSALPPIMAMAIIFQYVTWRSQSLWPAVCGHAMQNLLSAAAMFAKLAGEAAK